MKRRQIHIIFLLAAVVFISGCAGTAISRPPREGIPLDPLVETGVLDNGVTWYVRPNAEPEKRASLRLVVNAGSILEEEDQQGLAHLVEHMAFNGTKHFEKHELIDYLESIGMAFGPEINAYTGFDETVYMLEVPTDDKEILETAFQVLEDWAHFIAFDEKEIDAERGVVREEWRLGRGAQGRILDEYLPVLLAGSRYAERLPIGEMEVVMGAPYDRITGFYHDWYRPDLISVIAVGDFDPEEIQDLIKEHFSFKGPKNPPEREHYEVPGHKDEKTLIIRDPEVPSSQVELTVKHPPGDYRTEADYYDCLIESMVFSILNDRFSETARSGDPPFVYAGGNSSDFLRTLKLETYSAAADIQKIPEAVEAMVSEIRRVREQGFTRGELERKKADYLRSMENAYRERENLDSANLAGELIEYHLKGVFMPGIEAEYELFNRFIPRISLSEINRRAGELFPEHNRVFTAILPEQGPELTELDIRAAVVRGEAAPVETYEEEVVDMTLVEETPKAGDIEKKEYMKEIDTTVFRLSNGARVVVKPTDFREDEVLFQAFSQGGLSLVSDEEYVSAQYAPLLLSESGLGEFTAVQLEKRLAGVDVAVSPYISTAWEGLGGGGSPENLEELFQLIYLHFTEPSFREEAFINLTDRLRSLVRNRELDPQIVFKDTLNDLLTGGNFRSKPLTTARIDLMDFRTAERVYNERFGNPGDFTFVFVGNIDLDKAASLSEQWIASLPGSDSAEKALDRGNRPYHEGMEAVVERGTESKGRVGIGFAGELENWDEHTDTVMEALETVLDITLRERIREELSGTYGVSTSLSAFRLPYTGFRAIIEFGCEPSREEELTEAVFEEIEALRSGIIDPLTLTKVREQYRRSFEERIIRNQFWVSWLEESFRQGEDPADLLTPEEYNRIVTPESIREAAQTVFTVDRYIRVFLVPETVPVEE